MSAHWITKARHALAHALLRPEIQGAKESATSPALLAFGGGDANWRTNAGYEAFAREGYTQNTTVNACIGMIAKASSGIKINVYEGHPDDKPKQVTDGDLVSLLKRPNPRQAWSSFLQTWVSFQFIAGNGYVERVMGSRGIPRELYVPRADRMRVIPGNAQSPIGGYRYETGVGQPIVWKPDVVRDGEPVQQILHTKFFHPLDDFYGLSPIESAARSIDQANEAQAWNVALLQNGARPSGLLAIEADLGPDQRREWKDQLEMKHTGARNAGRPMVADGASKVTWVPMANTPAEMDWLNGLQLSSRQICSVMGVPALLVGDVSDPTFANYKEAHRFLWTETVLPLMDFLLGELSHWLTPFFGENLYIGYDRNDIEALREDQADVWDRAIKGYQGELINRNEARALIGHPPVPDGDAFRVAINSFQQGPKEKPALPGDAPPEAKSYYTSIARAQRRAA